MVLELRKASAFALLIGAASVFWSNAVAAFGYNDVYGRWCTVGGQTEFTPQYLKILRYSDNARFDFPISRYEFSEQEVTVFWIRADGSQTTTIYGRFSSDGRTMVQLPTAQFGERPHTRC